MIPITSCTNTNNNIISTITFNDISTNYKSKQEQNLSFQTRSFKCDDILYGNNSISNGNYVLFIASNTDHTPWPDWNMGTTKEQWQNNFKQSPIYSNAFVKGLFFEQSELQKNISDVSLLFYFDIYDCTNKITDHKGKLVNIYKDNDGNEYTDISPFKKWDDTTFLSTLKKNDGWIPNDDEKEKEFATSSYKDQYIRHDESAKNFRNFVERAQLLYPKNEQRTSSFSSNQPTCAFFVNSKLKNIDIMTERYWSDWWSNSNFVKNFQNNYCNVDKK